MADRSGRRDDRAYRAGFVALLGPPNAGKSTLLNRLLGEKLAIVTAKPQTTRSRILGILTLPKAQLLLVDTPGLHQSSKRLNTVLNEAVGEAARECDVAVLTVDASEGFGDAHEDLRATLDSRGTPYLIALNKIDLGQSTRGLGLPAHVDVMRVSARTGEGVPSLIEAIVARLPESPALYPEEELTDRPLRWLCGEIVREAAFECLDQELPYAIAVEVVRFDESRPELIVIHANLLVSRDSQKRIVVGAGGRTVKGIGMRARKAIQRLVDTRVHLELFVKVDPRWLKSTQRMDELGYR